MRFTHGETVTLHARTQTGVDADGNDTFGDVPTTLENVPVWPRNSSELTQGQDTLIVGYTAVLPAGTDVEAIDYVTRENGKDYEIDGEPGDYSSPFTGWDPGVVVNLKRVTG